MIQEGLLEAAGRPVDAAYAIHVSSGTYPRGVLLSRLGRSRPAATTWW